MTMASTGHKMTIEQSSGHSLFSAMQPDCSSPFRLRGERWFVLIDSSGFCSCCA